MNRLFTRIQQSVRWRLGMPVAAPELEAGTDESVTKFYNDRVTRCDFLEDPEHYEHPRAAWVQSQVRGPNLLEIGCGNGGMTRLIAPKVESLTALDVSAPSLMQVQELGLPNVVTAQALIENYHPGRLFDQIVLSEVIEHLRKPADAIEFAFGWLAPGGSLILTTPNGHWESDEHLHEFTLRKLSELLAGTGCESFEAGYLRDRDGRRRWLAAVVVRAEIEPTPDDFFDRGAIANSRRAR